MATVHSQSRSWAVPSQTPTPANNDDIDFNALSTDHKIIAWLFRATEKKVKESLFPTDATYLDRSRRFLIQRTREPNDDWQTVTSLCGYPKEIFDSLGLDLPLSAAEIDHFRRNHRGTDHFVGRDFLTARIDLPSPLAELYGLYRHRARLDTEATLFVAQATNSTRLARVMADLLAIGAYAQGHECIAHMMSTYAVPAAFDTSDLIDHANREAQRRLLLPVDHPAHFLKLSPDEVSVLATNIVEKNALSPTDFLEKASLLAEARQDVNRLDPTQQFLTSIREGDLPLTLSWVRRLVSAYVSVFRGWFVNQPEFRSFLSEQISA